MGNKNGRLNAPSPVVHTIQINNSGASALNRISLVLRKSLCAQPEAIISNLTVGAATNLVQALPPQISSGPYYITFTLAGDNELVTYRVQPQTPAAHTLNVSVDQNGKPQLALKSISPAGAATFVSEKRLCNIGAPIIVGAKGQAQVENLDGMKVVARALARARQDEDDDGSFYSCLTLNSQDLTLECSASSNSCSPNSCSSNSCSPNSKSSYSGSYKCRSFDSNNSRSCSPRSNSCYSGCSDSFSGGTLYSDSCPSDSCPSDSCPSDSCPSDSCPKKSYKSGSKKNKSGSKKNKSGSKKNNSGSKKNKSGSKKNNSGSKKKKSPACGTKGCKL